VQLVGGHLLVPGQHLDDRLGQQLVELGDEGAGRRLEAGAVGGLVPEAAHAALDREAHVGDGRPERLDQGAGDLDVHRVLADHPLGVEVVDERAVRADGDAPVTGRLHDVLHPARWAPGDERHDETGFLGGLQRPTGAVGDAAVGADDRAVEVGRDQPDGHRPTLRWRPWRDG
jgi:hypothetical protein